MSVAEEYFSVFAHGSKVAAGPLPEAAVALVEEARMRRRRGRCGKVNVVLQCPKGEYLPPRLVAPGSHENRDHGTKLSEIATTSEQNTVTRHFSIFDGCSGISESHGRRTGGSSSF